MIDVQQCCAPSTFDFGLPPDFMVDDDALELAALSEHIFSDTPFLLPVDEPAVQPLRAAGGSVTGSDAADADAFGELQASAMVSLHTLNAGTAPEQNCAQQQQLPDSVGSGGSASPASSGQASYKPMSDGGCSDGSDFTDSRQPLTPRNKAATTSATQDASKKVDIRIGKRKADVDLATIPDIQERRKQRRLAKNRATAATSRARKREQMSHMSVRVAELEAENAALRRALAASNAEFTDAAVAKPL